MSTLNVYSEVCGNDSTNIYYVNSDKHQLNKLDNWENELHVHYFFSPYLSFGDYDNSCAVERSNVRVFEQQFADCKNTDWVKITGGYGWECIAIRLSSTNEEIIETLQRLENYPAISDEDVSLMELEMEDEHWHLVYKDAFIKGLKTLADNSDDIYNEEVLNEDDLRQYYETLKERSNTYFQVEAGGNGYIDIDRLIESADIKEVASFLKFEYID